MRGARAGKEGRLAAFALRTANARAGQAAAQDAGIRQFHWHIGTGYGRMW